MSTKRSSICISVFVFTAVFLLCGCSREIDGSMLQVRNGVAYRINESSPFSGRVVSFFGNGQQKERVVYVQGKREGMATYWHENGQKEREGIFKNDLMNGHWQFWTKDGELNEGIMELGEQRGYGLSGMNPTKNILKVLIRKE